MKKSYLVSFVMTLTLGPLGLFYSSTPAALGFLLASIIFGVISVGMALVIIWPITIITGFLTVHRYNSNVVLEERRHQELLEATKGTGEES